MSGLNFPFFWKTCRSAAEFTIVLYIRRYAETYSANTLRFHLAAISHWHREAGFPDPTKSEQIRDLMREIEEKKSHPPKQTVPIAFDHLQKIVHVLEETLATSRNSGDHPALLKALRGRALILNGFWGGFRSDQLNREQVEFVEVYPGEKLDICIPNSKNDSTGYDTIRSVVARPQLCPVEAYIDWIEEAGINKGPVFRRIHKWGNLSTRGLSGKGMEQVLAKMARDAGLTTPLSAASLRLGFIIWAGEMGWDTLEISRYLQCKGITSIAKHMRYQTPSWGELAKN